MPDSAPTVVLVVEDDSLLRCVVVQELRCAGCEVLEASTGEDALARLHAGRRIDVVFTDIQLAGRLSGWDVASNSAPLTPACQSSTRLATPRTVPVGSPTAFSSTNPTALAKWLPLFCLLEA